MTTSRKKPHKVTSGRLLRLARAATAAPDESGNNAERLARVLGQCLTAGAEDLITEAMAHAAAREEYDVVAIINDLADEESMSIFGDDGAGAPPGISQLYALPVMFSATAAVQIDSVIPDTPAYAAFARYVQQMVVLPDTESAVVRTIPYLYSIDELRMLSRTQVRTVLQRLVRADDALLGPDLGQSPESARVPEGRIVLRYLLVGVNNEVTPAPFEAHAATVVDALREEGSCAWFPEMATLVTAMIGIPAEPVSTLVYYPDMYFGAVTSGLVRYAETKLGAGIYAILRANGIAPRGTTAAITPHGDEEPGITQVRVALLSRGDGSFLGGVIRPLYEFEDSAEAMSATQQMLAAIGIYASAVSDRTYSDGVCQTCGDPFFITPTGLDHDHDHDDMSAPPAPSVPPTLH